MEYSTVNRAVSWVLYYETGSGSNVGALAVVATTAAAAPAAAATANESLSDCKSRNGRDRRGVVALPDGPSSAAWSLKSRELYDTEGAMGSSSLCGNAAAAAVGAAAAAAVAAAAAAAMAPTGSRHGHMKAVFAVIGSFSSSESW